MLTDSWQTRIIAQIESAYPQAWALYAFGSQVQGEANAESDLDLALLMPHPIDAVLLWEQAQGLAQQLGMDVDLIDLQAASTVFRKQILETAQCLKQWDPVATAHFETLVFSQYLRFNEERQEILEGIQQDRQVYG